ncbi:MAG: hypothetical protein Kow0090_09670 [Myxococcota bacterium]
MKLSWKNIIGVTVLAVAFIFACSALADQRIHVVQKDDYHRDWAIEVAPLFGLQTNAKYTKSMGTGLSLAAIFNNLAAIELSGLYFLSSDTTAFYDYLGQGKTRYLPGGTTGDTFSLTPADSEVTIPEWAGTLALRLTPIYGKFTVMNSLLANVDVFFLCGAGVLNTKIPASIAEYLDPNIQAEFENMKIAGVFGGGMRFFLTRWLNIRLEVRDFIFPEKGRNDKAIQANERREEYKLRSSSVRSMFYGMVGFGFMLPP